jgi:hypothetical protein
VDAATKVGPLRELIGLVQQNAAAAMATPYVLPPLRLRCPDLWYLGSHLLAGKHRAGQVAGGTHSGEEEAALKVHREEARKQARKKANEMQQLRPDRMTAEEKATFKTKRNEMQQLRLDRMAVEEKAALNTNANEKRQHRVERMPVEEKAAFNTKRNEGQHVGRAEGRSQTEGHGE